MQSLKISPAASCDTLTFPAKSRHIQFPSLNCIYGLPVTPLEILLLVDLKECPVVTKGCLLTIMIFFFRTNNNGSEASFAQNTW